jgi:hypothetical protein
MYAQVPVEYACHWFLLLVAAIEWSVSIFWYLKNIRGWRLWVCRRCDWIFVVISV